MLQYIQASALAENAIYTKPAFFRRYLRNVYLTTWRDARFEALRNRIEEEQDNDTPPLLDFISKSFKKRSMSFPFNRPLHPVKWVKSGSSILKRFQSKDRVANEFEGDEKKETIEQELDAVGLELDAFGQSSFCTEDNWAWVSTHDELARAMKDGSVLFGFVEAPIKFPPSFKWKEGGHAGDFTDMVKLEGE